MKDELSREVGSNLPAEPDEAQDEALGDDEAEEVEQEAVEPFDKPQAPDNSEKGPEFFRNPEGGPLITEDPGPQDADAPVEG